MGILNLKKWVCVCVASLFINVSTLFAATLTVPSPLYPTIQSAINSASDGDTVLVASGTYYENVNYKKKNIKPEALVTQDVTLQNDSQFSVRRLESNSSLESFEAVYLNAWQRKIETAGYYEIADSNIFRL